MTLDGRIPGQALSRIHKDVNEKKCEIPHGARTEFDEVFEMTRSWMHRMHLSAKLVGQVNKVLGIEA